MVEIYGVNTNFVASVHITLSHLIPLIVKYMFFACNV